MKRIVLGFLLFFSAIVTAQKEASFWYFGQNAGLQFNEDTGTVAAVTNGQINTLEGCTTISDADGNLLFYSDGSTVWNRNHQIMLNGTGLRGDDSSTSSGVIVPKPQDPDFYYIFTVDEPHHNNTLNFPEETANDGVNDGLMYSRVNILDDGGLGAVDAIEKNIPLVTYDTTDQLATELKCSEKITAVKADDCFSFWVITHFGDTFYAFKIDENGVDPNPVTSVVGPNIPLQGYRRNALGYLKASPDGTKLVSANFGESTVPATDAGGGIYLFDFDNDSGTVSNTVELYSAQNNNSPYGVEFSAENQKIYATVGLGPSGNGASQLLQWDLTSVDIPNSLQVVHTSNTISAGALQLGIDRRIYRAQFEFANNTGASRFLAVIENPEADSPDIIYNEQGVLLDVTGFNQNTSRIGLPPFIQSLFNSQIDIIRNGISSSELKLCIGDSYTLEADNIANADYFWFFDGNPLTVDANGNPVTDTNSQLIINTPGFYEVFIEPNNGECPIEGSAIVGIFDIPVANTVSNVFVCDDALNDGIFQNFDFTSKDTEALLGQDPTQYKVSYFESMDDANNFENDISFPFTNATNPQVIYARVYNKDNPNCFDITSFEIEVFDTPQIVQISDLEFCDDEGDQTDGFSIIQLGDLIPLITGSQNENTTNVTFHSTQEDADNKFGALPLTYPNITAFVETIFVRIENMNKEDCYSTSSFNITINPAPTANNINIVQCDEDGIPEGLTTFNIRQFNDDVTSASPNSSVDYYLSISDAEAQNSPINADAFDNSSNPQIIYARVTNDNTNCISFSQISLQVSTTTSNNASLSQCDDDGIEDGFATFNLNDSNAIVLAGAPAGLLVSYYETYQDALLESNPIGTSFTNTVPYNQTIYARVENNNACYGISQIELTILELPNVETTFETIYCLNDFPNTIELNGGIINDSPSNYFYDWSTGENTSTIEVNAPGTYSVRISNTNGCFKDRTITVVPSNKATNIDVIITDATENNSISIMVSGEGDYEYALDDSNGPYQDSNSFDGLEPGFYTIFVRDKNDCGIVDKPVSVIGFPKFFTPNNDNTNDFWQIKGINKQFQSNSSIFIFDRHGKLLKELNPLGPGWDGTYNGAKMPTSDYWFKVQLEDGRTFTSHFTLKR